MEELGNEVEEIKTENAVIFQEVNRFKENSINLYEKIDKYERRIVWFIFWLLFLAMVVHVLSAICLTYSLDETNKAFDAVRQILDEIIINLDNKAANN